MEWMNLKPLSPLEENTIVFCMAKKEILKLCENGDIFVQGRLAENDKEVVDAMRLFLASQGFIK